MDGRDAAKDLTALYHELTQLIDRVPERTSTSRQSSEIKTLMILRGKLVPLIERAYTELQRQGMISPQDASRALGWVQSLKDLNERLWGPVDPNKLNVWGPPDPSKLNT